jgi:hypothetical protein
MGVVIGKIKCCFCGTKGGIIHSVNEYGIYGEIGKRMFYHPECLEIRQIYPTAFDHRSVDMAIKIVELIQENERKDNSHIIQSYKDKAKTLERSHFEQLIPK